MTIVGKNLQIAGELDEEGDSITGYHAIIGGSKFKPPEVWGHSSKLGPGITPPNTLKPQGTPRLDRVLVGSGNTIAWFYPSMGLSDFFSRVGTWSTHKAPNVKIPNPKPQTPQKPSGAVLHLLRS
jgi:hypothetical protein